MGGKEEDAPITAVLMPARSSLPRAPKNRTMTPPTTVIPGDADKDRPFFRDRSGRNSGRLEGRNDADPPNVQLFRKLRAMA
jgi:hypothetical protein